MPRRAYHGSSPVVCDTLAINYVIDTIPETEIEKCRSKINKWSGKYSRQVRSAACRWQTESYNGRINQCCWSPKHWHERWINSRIVLITYGIVTLKIGTMLSMRLKWDTNTMVLSILDGKRPRVECTGRYSTKPRRPNSIISGVSWGQDEG